MTISLDPPKNDRFLAIANALPLSPEDCQRITSHLDPDLWAPAAITYEDRAGGYVSPDVRSVLSQRIPVTAGGWPVRQIMTTITELNGDLWRYDLDRFTMQDYPNVLMYEASAGDHFRSHTDAGPYTASRKLSFSIQLSDPTTYRGGDLLFADEGLIASRDQGALTIFPSVMEHEVTPVISGTRLAIVGWVHGPTFR